MDRRPEATRAARSAWPSCRSTSRWRSRPRSICASESTAVMCRNIKTLFNFEPPATELEIRDASLQFVRKLSGFTVPSKANEAAFDAAVQKVADAARELIAS